MSVSVAISPSGRLALYEDSESFPEISADARELLCTAFDSSSPEGLLLLASQSLHEELPASLVFWRELARNFFQAVCQLGEGGISKWKSAGPNQETLATMVADAPPMRGLEYLTVQRLEALWIELRELAISRGGEFSGGPAAWLAGVNPLWRLLGRVTFNLAENKRDPDRPFAFLATYTHKLSRQSKLQHLPLADALKTYAGAQDRQKLESLLEPVRRAAQRSELAKELLESRSLFSPQAWSVRQAHRFLMESAAIEAAGVVVRLPDWWSARHRARPQVDVRVGQKSSGAFGADELLDFQASVSLDSEPLTEEERRALLEGSEGLMLLRGKWVEVDRQKLTQALNHWQTLAAEHPDGIDVLAGMRLLSGVRLEQGDVHVDEVADWTRVSAGDRLRETLERLRQPGRIEAFQPGRDLAATLRPYQVEGVKWLAFMMELGLGACLADDMGLGKTIQVIDVLLQRKRAAGKSRLPPNLLIAPASLLGNWRQEISRFAPSLSVFVAHRSETSAEDLERVSADPERELANVDLVMTTYGLARRQAWLGKLKWSLAVLDEAQAIKNAGSSQAKSVKRISAAGRIVLTGTPVENHLGDLWSLFDFLNPGLLGSAADFRRFIKRVGAEQESQSFGALRRLVRPYILRRMKTDPAIAPDLPEKTEMRAECGLAKKQAALYERVVGELARRLKTAEGMARRGLVLATLMQLKQICNHPDQYLSAADSPGPYAPEQSGKFERLAMLCEPIIERQEKALVFTQFQSLTEPLANFLATIFGRPGLVLHGATPVKQRAELVRAFQGDDGAGGRGDGGPPFFVISLKAGGSGLNLTAASHVIHFDRWWNPAVENQATDRAFRIGQKRNVLVHKFVCRGTVEEKIDAMLTDKQNVADAVLDADGEQRLTELSNDELLRFVALDIGRAGGD